MSNIAHLFTFSLRKLTSPMIASGAEGSKLKGSAETVDRQRFACSYHGYHMLTVAML